MEAIHHTSVVIVGAGPSGLALAIELGTRGIECLLVERNDRVGYAPRAKTTNVRTRTHLRRWGIADRLAELSPFGVDYPSTVSFVTSLGGAKLVDIPNASNCDPTPTPLYPEHGQWIPQYKLEQVLRERVETLPTVRIAFSTEFVGASQDENGAYVRLRDLVAERDISARCAFAVGADGARSRMRDIIGATMTGTYGLSRNYNIVFRAPGLADAHPHGPSVMYWQVNPAMPSLIGPMDEGDIWFFMPTRLEAGTSIDTSNAADMIRAATGIDLPYEVLSSDEWTASSLIADRYRDRRIFLVGDACHLHPPFGGYGMNMGIADGVDLGWKLAAVLQSWGGKALLDSYEIERRGIHMEVIAEAAANHALLSNDFWADGLDQPGPVGEALRSAAGERIRAAKEREFHTLGTVLGGSYNTSPIIALEPAGDRKPANGSYTPDNFPGALAPHMWMSDGSSLYDQFGDGFTLIATPDAAGPEPASCENDAAALGIPLKTVRITAAEAENRYFTPLTLIRPDQHVAWRGSRWHEDILRGATGYLPPIREPAPAESHLHY